MHKLGMQTVGDKLET